MLMALKDNTCVQRISKGCELLANDRHRNLITHAHRVQKSTQQMSPNEIPPFFISNKKETVWKPQFTLLYPYSLTYHHRKNQYSEKSISKLPSKVNKHD